MLSFERRVLVWVWESEREQGSHHSTSAILIAVCVCVCVCVCVWERHVQPIRNRLNRACLQTPTSFITVSVTGLCSPLGLELMVKLRTLLTVFTLILKAEGQDYGKGRYISDAVCSVRPITMHWVSWPIRADCACRKEGLCRKRSLREAGHRGPTIMYSRGSQPGGRGPLGGLSDPPKGAAKWLKINLNIIL